MDARQIDEAAVKVRQIDEVTLFEGKDVLIVVIDQGHDDTQSVLTRRVDNVVVDVPVPELTQSRFDRVLISDADSAAERPNRVGSHSDGDGECFSDSFLRRRRSYRSLTVLILTQPINIYKTENPRISQTLRRGKETYSDRPCGKALR